MEQSGPTTILDQENPLQMFLYALKAPESKRQYPKRLKVFLDFLTFKNELSHSDLENQCKEFMTKSQIDPKWTTNDIIMTTANENNDRAMIKNILEQNDSTTKNIITNNNIIEQEKTQKLAEEQKIQKSNVMSPPSLP